MRMLGRMGRCGNQILQYAFLKTYARRHNLELQIPAWFGNEFFDINDPACGASLPTQVERKDRRDQAPLPEPGEFIDKDFHGWGQFHMGWYNESEREYLKQIFRPTQHFIDRYEPAAEKMTGLRVGIHIRRGDYGSNGYFWNTPIEWYLKAMQKLCQTLNGKPSVFIASEDAGLVRAFSHYDPMTAEKLGVELRDAPIPNYNYLPYDLRKRDPREMDFYADWYLLSRCHVMLAPNSTFSYTAAMFSQTGRAFYRSELASEGFIQIDPWNNVPLNRDRAEDYPWIGGTLATQNPYWKV